VKQHGGGMIKSIYIYRKITRITIFQQVCENKSINLKIIKYLM